jgi:hypothetical protein
MSGEGLGPFPWTVRATLLALAFVATGVHAGSFLLVPGEREWLEWAGRLAVASVVSWPCMGACVWGLCRREADGWRKVWGWFDACLVTMNVGEMVLAGSTAINLLVWRGVVRAEGRAVGLWGVLNGVCGVGMVVLGGLA